MKWFTALLLILCCCLIGLNPVAARPGGGHSSSGHSSSSHSSSSSSWHSSSYSSWHSSSYSSGSSWGSSSSSGSSSEDSDAIFWFIVFLIIVVIVLVIIGNSKAQSINSRPPRNLKTARNQAIAEAIAALQERDPNFSKILLTDFTHLLFSKLYHYAGCPEFSYLTPFLSAELQQQYQFIAPQPAEEIVINGIQWESVGQQETQDQITLQIDANYSLDLHGNKARFAVTERWLMCRSSGQLSPEPKKMQALSCPNCAAPAHFNDAGVCPYCKSTLQRGESQWFLQQRVITQKTQLESSSLVSYAEEQGTQLATVFQPELQQNLSQLQQAQNLSNWDEFYTAFEQDIVTAYFLSIYQHWSACDWDGVRHLLSDRLYEANQFWTDMYQQQHWFNRLDNLKINRIELVKIELDRFYLAITVRIFAACNDYTEDAQGKLIGGNKKTLRRYSEYWTFVRRSDTSPTGAQTVNLQQCPQCGAPADQMGQAAKCGYCGSKISTGEFSWVLFLITQDENYTG